MNTAKRLARQIYCTGKTNRVPSEEEEHEIQTKYKLGYAHSPSFDNEVKSIIRPDKGTAKPSHDRHILADIVDEFEDRFKIDFDNVSTRKYLELDKKIKLVKDYFIAKIRVSELSTWYKQSLVKDIEECETAQCLLVLLYYRIGINES